MLILVRLYRACNLLSLDVAVGAVISAHFFAKNLNVSSRVIEMVILAVAVWIIYTTDHLLDVRNRKTSAATERHQFHQQHQKVLWVLISLGVATIASLIYFVRLPVFISGIILSVLVAIYLVTQKYLKVKEIFIAVLYTAGVLLPAWSVSVEPMPEGYHLLITQFFLIALINLLLFSWYGVDEDKQDGHASAAIAWGKSSTAYLINILCVVSFMITGWMVLHYEFSMSVFVLLLMTLALFAIFSFESFFRNNARYRLYGDAVFFLPLLQLLS